MPRTKEFAFQPGLAGLTPEGAVLPSYLEYLTRLRPEVVQYQPLALIDGRVGEIVTTSVKRSLIKKIMIFPNAADFDQHLREQNDKFAGLVVMADRVEEADLRLLINALKKPPRADKHRIWVMGEVDPQILSRFGLVYPETGTDSRTGLSWVTGRPEKITRRKSINLFKRFPWISSVKETVAGQYQKWGFTVVSTAEVDALLAKSLYPPATLRRLRAGDGVFVRGPCGSCLHRIYNDGTAMQVLDCADEDNCQAIIEKLKPKETPKCSCGQFCVWHKNPGKYICPSCGEAEST